VGMPKSKLAELNALITGVVSRIKKTMLIKTDMERSFLSMQKDRKMCFCLVKNGFPAGAISRLPRKPINRNFNALLLRQRHAVCECLLQDLVHLVEEEL